MYLTNKGDYYITYNFCCCISNTSYLPFILIQIHKIPKEITMKYHM